MIVATAGHVDHGKTALVAALTGVDTDRLPEEKARGLTIDLGFAYLPLASGHVAGFIDVPGHERFVRNMVAGVAGIDLALLVIAADDGVMPQSREHVAVLDLLGVRRALVAVTKTDRVDPGRVAEVGREARGLLAPTAMANAPVFPVCAPRGEGIAELLAALETVAGDLPAAPGAGGFRLAVDRVFVLKGAGTVVTGTIHAGNVAVGDRVAVLPGGEEARVRSIRAQDRATDQARRGQRAALNLAGIDHDRIGRGAWVVTPDLLRPAPRLDLRLRVPADAAGPVGHWTPVHVHHGAGHVTGRVALLETAALAPGTDGWAQLVLDRPLPAAFGDRIVLRDQSARRTVAGGRVVDPDGPARGRARPERLTRLAAMDADEPAAALDALLSVSTEGVELDRFARARNLPPEEATKLFDDSAMEILGRGPARRGLAAGRRRATEEALVAAIEQDHATRQDRLGPTLAELARLPSLQPAQPVLEPLAAALVADGRLFRRGAVLHRPGHAVTLAPADRDLWRKVDAALAPEEGTPPALHPLADSLGLAPSELERFLQRMAGFGLVQAIARNRWLTPAQISRYAEAARVAAAQAGPEGFTAAQFRDAAGIGRNLAIDLVEFLDRSGTTLRRGDRRVIAAEGSP